MRRLGRPIAFVTTAVLAGAVIGWIAEQCPRLPPAHFKPAPWAWNLPIDGASYVLGAWRLWQAGDWIVPPDTFHSVGMQILLAALFRLEGRVSPFGIHLWNFVLWIGILGLVGWLGWRRRRSARAGLVVVALVAQCRGLSAYVGMVQYEITAAFLCLLVVALQTLPKHPARDGAAGVLIALLAIVRAHFLLLIPALLLVQERSRRAPIPLVGGFLLLAVPFTLHLSQRRGEWIFFQDNVEYGVLTRDLHEESRGLIYPYSKRWAPGGLEFIWQRPGAYGKLLVDRAALLFGVEHHVWYVDSRITEWLSRWGAPPVVPRALLALFCLGLALWGVAAAVARGEPLTPLAPWLVVVAPFLLINTASRLFVPALPVFLWFVFLGGEDGLRRAARLFDLRAFTARPV